MILDWYKRLTKSPNLSQPLLCQPALTFCKILTPNKLMIILMITPNTLSLSPEHSGQNLRHKQKDNNMWKKGERNIVSVFQYKRHL